MLSTEIVQPTWIWPLSKASTRTSLFHPMQCLWTSFPLFHLSTNSTCRTSSKRRSMKHPQPPSTSIPSNLSNPTSSSISQGVRAGYLNSTRRMWKSFRIIFAKTSHTWRRKLSQAEIYSYSQRSSPQEVRVKMNCLKQQWDSRTLARLSSICLRVWRN